MRIALQFVPIRLETWNRERKLIGFVLCMGCVCGCIALILPLDYLNDQVTTLGFLFLYAASSLAAPLPHPGALSLRGIENSFKCGV
jgi:hypothetical protein